MERDEYSINRKQFGGMPWKGAAVLHTAAESSILSISTKFYGSVAIKKLLILLGLSPTEYEQKVLDAIKKSGYKTMRVYGRGGLSVDVSEVYKTDSHREALEIAHRIVNKVPKK